MMYLNVWTKAEETSSPKLMSIHPHGEDIEIACVKDNIAICVGAVSIYMDKPERIDMEQTA